MTGQPQARSVSELKLSYDEGERELLVSLDFARIPVHVAAIMDGNGRWARRQFKERIFGHETARRTVRTVVETCRDLGVRYLTLYAFSNENWKRPAHEVAFLMKLLGRTLVEEQENLHANGIRLQMIGDPRPLPVEVRQQIEQTIDRLAGNSGMLLTLAINYGGRQDIVRACTKLARKVWAGELAADAITEELVAQNLYTGGMPDPELLIRTGGEFRVSNFLLWQISYAELWVTPILWPEFRRIDLLQAIRWYQERDRRFGGVR